MTIYTQNYDGMFVLDLEACFSRIAINEDNTITNYGVLTKAELEELKASLAAEGRRVKWKTDVGVPFNTDNRVTDIGVYEPSSNTYTELSPEREEDMKYLRALIKKSHTIVGHNVKYDCHWLTALGFDINHLHQDDTMTREYVLWGGWFTYKDLGLDKLAPVYGGEAKLDKMKEAWKAGYNTHEIAHEIRSPYLKGDVMNTWKVWLGQESHQNRQKFDRMLTFKKHLNGAVQRMEYEGFVVDDQFLLDFKKTVRGYIQEATFTLFDMIDRELEKAGIEMIALPDDSASADKLKAKYANEPNKMCVSSTSSQQMSHLLYGLRMKKMEDFVNDHDLKMAALTSYKADTARLEELAERMKEANTEKKQEAVQKLIDNEEERRKKRARRHLEELAKARAKENADYWAAHSPRAKTQRDLDDLIKQCMVKLPYGFGAKPVPLKQIVGKTGLSAGKAAVEILVEKKQTKKASAFMEAILNVSKYETWDSLCINALLQNICDDGRIHTNFNVSGTASGRFSCSQPNMQNLPSAKKHDGKNMVRGAVKSRYGDKGYIVAIDYSQLELRYVMEIANDQQGINDYINGVDMHSATSQMVFDGKNGEGAYEKAEDSVKKEFRGAAKIVNFGLLYGNHYTDELKASLKDTFYLRYTAVAPWQEYVANCVRASEWYINPITGWGYYFKGANDENYWKGYDSKGRGWRNKAMNYPVQGGGNEIIQAPTIVIDKKLREIPELAKAHLIGQVHDELVFDVHEECLDKLLEVGYEWMEGCNRIIKHYFKYDMKVPFVVEATKGRDWYSQEDIGRK